MNNQGKSAGVRRTSRGITLVELLVALVIVAILAAVAIPQYNRFQFRGYRTDVMSALGQCAMAAERQYGNTFTYVGIRDGANAPLVCDEFAPANTDAGTARYRITVPAATTTAFTLRATPVNAQVGDGIIETDSTNAQGWDQDNSGTIDADENTWAEH